MTKAEVIAEVDGIRRYHDDGEAAHGQEDRLHKRVLRAIAEGACDDPAGCAAEALKTLEIDFARWCA
jgi:hypothetical protein